MSTLALHFIVIYVGAEYETRRGFSTGIVIDPPRIGEWVLRDARVWYFVLLAFAAANGALQPEPAALAHRAAPGARSTAAKRSPRRSASTCPRTSSLAFVVSSTITAVAGCLFAYYRGFVSVEAFSLFLTIQYVAMVIIGGMGSILGAVLGAGVRDAVSLRDRGADGRAAACRRPVVGRCSR